MRKGILLLIICLGFSISVQGQAAEKITLEEAIDIALTNNYQLKQAKNDLDFARDQEFSEKADFLPSLNASSSGFRQIGRQFIPGTDRFDEVGVSGFSSSLDLGLPIFSGFENINSLRSSQDNTKSTTESLQWTRESIIFQTATSYLQVILDKELREIAREDLENSQKQLEQVQAQVEVGSRPTVDLYNQEATVANNELEVTNRQNALTISKIQLIRQLQVDPLKEYEFETPEINPEQIVPQEYNLQEMVATALENRSDFQSEKFNVQSLENQLDATRGSLYPSLSFNASVSTSYNDQNFNPATGELFSFNDQFFDQNINRSFRLSLNIPIFNNWNTRTNVQAQKVNYKNAKLALENVELQVVQEVNQAYADYQAVIQRLESTEKALRAAQRLYETEKERYNVGAGTLIELSDANAQFVQARSNRAQAVLDFIFQEKLLDYYVGKLDENISLEQ